MTQAHTDPANSPSPQRGNMVLATLAGIVASGVGAVLYYVVCRYANIEWLVPPLLIGAMVGLAVRFAGQGRDPQFRLLAAALTVAGAMGGYFWLDYWNFTPFMLGQTIGRMLSLMSLLIYAVSAYIAYLIAARSA